jgi:hypothetical protein
MLPQRHPQLGADFGGAGRLTSFRGARSANPESIATKRAG